MSYCPKCNKEYDDALSECPYCAEDAESGKKGLSKGAIAGIIAAVAVIAAAIVLVVMLMPKNDSTDKGNTSSGLNDSSAVEELTMPSGYEDVVNNIKDSDGHVITEATDSYGNTITREVDGDGNVTTTFVGPDGSTSRVTTDRNGNILSYDIPASGGEASLSSSPNNGNSASSNAGNTSSAGSGSNNLSSSNSNQSSSSSNNTSSDSNSGENQNSGNGAITINGKNYKVGDTVTLRATVGGINEAVAGCAFQVTFDENLLELDKKSVNTFDPSFILNTNLNGEILGSAMSAMTGFDLSAPVQLLECKFTVKDSDTKSCDINFAMTEVYTGTGSDPLVDVTADTETEFTVE